MEEGLYDVSLNSVTPVRGLLYLSRRRIELQSAFNVSIAHVEQQSVKTYWKPGDSNLPNEKERDLLLHIAGVPPTKVFSLPQSHVGVSRFLQAFLVPSSTGRICGLCGR